MRRSWTSVCASASTSTPPTSSPSSGNPRPTDAAGLPGPLSVLHLEEQLPLHVGADAGDRGSDAAAGHREPDFPVHPGGGEDGGRNPGRRIKRMEAVGIAGSHDRKEARVDVLCFFSVKQSKRRSQRERETSSVPGSVSCARGLALVGAQNGHPDSGHLMSRTSPSRRRTFLDAFVAENPEHPDRFHVPAEDVEGYLMPKAASGEMPDFISINGGSFGADLADRGILADLRGTFAEKNTIDAVKPQFTSPKGKLFGIAGGVSTQPHLLPGAGIQGPWAHSARQLG